MTDKLTNAEIRRLKAEAQRLKATFKLGKHGLSPEFLEGLNAAFRHHELIKVKFDEFKAEKKTLAPQLAEKTSSHLVWLIGNVAVLYRPKLKDKPSNFQPASQSISTAPEPNREPDNTTTTHRANDPERR